MEGIDVNAPLTCEHTAQMIWNALKAKEVEYSYTLVTNPDGSISSKVGVKDVTKYDSLMTDKSGAEITVPNTCPAVIINAGDRAEFDDNVQYIFIDTKEKEGTGGYDQSSILFADTVTDNLRNESYVNNEISN